MRKILLTILFIIIIAVVAWWLVLTLKESSISKMQVPPAKPYSPITTPPPDTALDLSQDNLNEAISEIEALE